MPPRTETIRHTRTTRCIKLMASLPLPDAHHGPGIIGRVLDVIPREEAQTAAAVALAGDDVEIAVAVPVDRVGAGDQSSRSTAARSRPLRRTWALVRAARPVFL